MKKKILPNVTNRFTTHDYYIIDLMQMTLKHNHIHLFHCLALPISIIIKSRVSFTPLFPSTQQFV